MPITNIDDKSCQELYDGVDRNPLVRLFQYIKFSWILPLPNDTKASLLDVGCARGNFLLTMSGRGYTDLYGLDIDNALYPAAAERVVFFRESLCTPELNLGRCFQHVFVQCMLHHLPVASLADVACNLARLCAPGGSLFIYEPNMDSLIGRFFYFTFLRLIPAMHRNAISEKEEQLAFCMAWERFIHALENQGFQTQKHSNWSFYKCYVATLEPGRKT